MAYIDIIGWGNATSKNVISKQVQQALEKLDDWYKYSSPEFRHNMEKEYGIDGNPFYNGIEVGLFSDGLLVTMTLEHAASFILKGAKWFHF